MKFVYSSVLKIEVVCPPKMWCHLQRIRRYNQRNRISHSRQITKIQFDKIFLYFKTPIFFSVVSKDRHCPMRHYSRWQRSLLEQLTIMFRSNYSLFLWDQIIDHRVLKFSLLQSGSVGTVPEIITENFSGGNVPFVHRTQIFNFMSTSFLPGN